MKINRKLNLVLDVERADGSVVHVHHTPIPQEVYDAHWELISRTVSGLYMKKMLPTVAVRVGLKALQSMADEMGIREIADKDLFPNIWRLTNVILPSERGWVPTPLDVVVSSGMGLDPEDIEEVKQYIAFFTSASWVHPRKELGTMLYPMLADTGALFVPSNSTEYATSLPTSKPAAPTGPSPSPSAPPH
jgi:hypothetical protein